MVIKEIDGDTFNTFAQNHILKNFYQTKEYGTLMEKSDYSVMYIGGFLNDTIVAGSLILYKTIGPSMKYGYAPRGFLIDYYDEDMLKTFTKKVKDYFFKRAFAFIKINPEITYAQVDLENKSKTINSRNRDLIEQMKELGYDKLKDNLYFESLLPKFTPVIYLPTYDISDLDAALVNSVRDAELSGIKLINGSEDDLEKFYSLIEYKTDKTLAYYKKLYEIFHPHDMADLLLVELNYDDYVKFLQKKNMYETERNEQINIEFNRNPNSQDAYRRKMKSDKVLASIASEIVKANTRMHEDNIKEVLGAALVIKHQGRITIEMVGTIKDYDITDVKSFIYFKIIEEYKKKDYLYCDLNGITGDYSDTNPYRDLNEFKLRFKPNVFEYIGEMDLIVNKPFHQILWSTNKIQKEFYRPALKK